MSSMSTIFPAGTPSCTMPIAKADKTAAAGAQGALIKRSVPPKVEAIRPMTEAPTIPARAPSAA